MKKVIQAAAIATVITASFFIIHSAIMFGWPAFHEGHNFGDIWIAGFSATICALIWLEAPS